MLGDRRVRLLGISGIRGPFRRLEDKVTRFFRKVGIWSPTDATPHPRRTKSLTAIAASSIFYTFNSCDFQSSEFRDDTWSVCRIGGRGYVTYKNEDFLTFRRKFQMPSSGWVRGLSGSSYTYLAAGDVTSRAAHTSRCQIYVTVPPPVTPRFVNPEECNCSACLNVGKSPLLYAAQQPNLA